MAWTPPPHPVHACQLGAVGTPGTAGLTTNAISRLSSRSRGLAPPFPGQEVGFATIEADSPGKLVHCRAVTAGAVRSARAPRPTAECPRGGAGMGRSGRPESHAPGQCPYALDG